MPNYLSFSIGHIANSTSLRITKNGNIYTEYGIVTATGKSSSPPRIYGENAEITSNDLSNYSSLVMDLAVEGKLLGTFSVLAQREAGSLKRISPDLVFGGAFSIAQ